uniref:Uncharacterized protein n=1 Tax=Pongo abelii TaxID=9601 RepID=A0A8I5TCV7_PONAB
MYICGHIAYIYTFLFFETGSPSVIQAGVQWCSYGSLQPQFPGSSNPPTSTSSVAGAIDAPPHLANFLVFSRDEVSLYCLGWSQTLEVKQSSCISIPKCWHYRHDSLCPANV